MGRYNLFFSSWMGQARLVGICEVTSIIIDIIIYAKPSLYWIDYKYSVMSVHKIAARNAASVELIAAMN